MIFQTAKATADRTALSSFSSLSRDVKRGTAVLARGPTICRKARAARQAERRRALVLEQFQECRHGRGSHFLRAPMVVHRSPYPFLSESARAGTAAGPNFARAVAALSNTAYVVAE